MRNATNTFYVSYGEAKQFTFKNGNRHIIPSHVANIKKDMVNDLPYFAPIIVNEATNNVLDGQNRLHAFMGGIEQGILPEDAELLVTFVNCPPDEEMDQILKYNNNTKSWSLDTYVESYVNQGNQNYVKLVDFAETHSLCHAPVKTEKKEGEKKQPKKLYRYTYSIIKGENGAKKMCTGDIHISYDDLAKAEDVHAELETLLDILGITKNGSGMESFCILWNEYRTKHSFKNWKKMFKTEKNSIIKKMAQTKFRWKDVFDSLNGKIYDIEKKEEA